MAEELWRYFPFISRIGHQIEQSKAQKELSDLQRLALLAVMFQEYPELAGVPSVQQMAERRGYPMMPTHERPMRTPMPSGTQPVGTPPTLAPIREGLRVGRQPWIPKGKTEKLIDQFRRLYAQKGREFPGKGQLRIGAEGGVSFQPPDVPKLITLGETERLVHPETGEVITPASKKEEKKPRKPDYTFISTDKKGNPVAVGVWYDAEGKEEKRQIIGPSFQKPTAEGEKVPYEKDEKVLTDDLRQWTSLENTIASGGIDSPFVQAMIGTNPRFAEAWQQRGESGLLQEATEQRQYIESLLQNLRMEKAGVKIDLEGNMYIEREGKKYYLIPKGQ